MAKLLGLIFIADDVSVGVDVGVRHTFDQDPMQALGLFGVGTLMALIFYFSAYVLYRKFGYENAIISALACGGRNVLYTTPLPRHLWVLCF